MVFDLSRLTDSQRAIIEGALADWKFDPEVLVPGLQASVGRASIPVEFIDLSRYSDVPAATAFQRNAEDHGDHHHSGGHVHVEDPETGDKGHGIEYRHRVLGLAWYSGKVSVEQDLEANPALAREVFNAEGAHMIDFFWMTDDDRAKIAAALHDDGNWQHADHGWFEERGDQDYYDWPGETFMDLFILAATPDEPSMDMRWTHGITDASVEACRQVLSRGFRRAAFGAARSQVYHTTDHLRKTRRDSAAFSWPSEQDAQAAGRRKCLICNRRDS